MFWVLYGTNKLMQERKQLHYDVLTTHVLGNNGNEKNE